ncbi:hypothetical protein KCU65_g7372, partial [Aureobasidium melanogenum]
MSPIRTDKPRLEAGDNNDKKLPSLRNMYISVSRVKPYVGPKWNCQLSIKHCIFIRNPVNLSSLNFTLAMSEIEVQLDIDIETKDEDGDDDGENWCLVWPMSESGKLGRVYDDVSLQAAVQDYRRAGKSIVELYVIKNKDACKKL